MPPPDCLHCLPPFLSLLLLLRSTKLVAFQWCGPKVSKMKTSKAIPIKAEIFKFFKGAVVTLEIYDRNSLVEADIEARLRACGGAHQPLEMVFPGGGSAKVLHDVSASAPAAPAAAPAPAPAQAAAAPAAFPKAQPAISASSLFSEPQEPASSARSAAAEAELAELRAQLQKATSRADGLEAELAAARAELSSATSRAEAAEAEASKARAESSAAPAAAPAAPAEPAAAAAEALAASGAAAKAAASISELQEALAALQAALK
jgi:hypothetical protein